MLKLLSVESGYGETQVLFDVSVEILPNQVHAILGRNGAGKTTLLKTIMGLVKKFQGEIEFVGHSLESVSTSRIAELGVAYVPETRDIFPSLTVQENLELAQLIGSKVPEGRWSIQRIFELFPWMDARSDNFGDQLSGGEQQMLAIGRALLMNPKLLILDEPTEGLAPVIVQKIHQMLSSLKEENLTIILVEQNFGFATSLADTVSIVGKGQIVWQGSSAAIRADKETQHRWLGV
jgi:branched-chain amino acid transport system ATP-binding protein